MSVRRAIAPFAAGVIFAVGLAIGGMTQPAKVSGFLDFTGDWDPSLAIVMAFAIGVHATSLRLITRFRRPILADRFELPTRRDITPALVIGAATFGVGWGLSGFCPAPAIASILTFSPEPWIWTGMVLLGMWLHQRLFRRRTRATRPIATRT